VVTCGYTDFSPNRAFTTRSVGVVLLDHDGSNGVIACDTPCDTKNEQ